MKGRQINFFVMPDEWDILEKYLIDNDLLCISDEEQTTKIKQTAITEGGIYKYFVLKNHLDNIVFETTEDSKISFINVLFSPVIEFARCYYNAETNTLNRSRLYYTRGYFNENNEWQDKEVDFLLSAEQLFKWFRKNYKDVKMSDYKGFLITERVKEKIEKDGLKLNEI